MQIVGHYFMRISAWLFEKINNFTCFDFNEQTEKHLHEQLIYPVFIFYLFIYLFIYFLVWPGSNLLKLLDVWSTIKCCCCKK